MTVGVGIALALGVGAAAEDLRRRRVPNWMTATAAGGALAWAARGGWHPLGLAATGLLVGFVVLLPLHCCGAMGGGDVKLMAAYGALLGPSGILVALVFAGVLGGICAAAMLLWMPRAAAIPYAPAIVLGAWISLIGGGA